MKKTLGCPIDRQAERNTLIHDLYAMTKIEVAQLVIERFPYVTPESLAWGSTKEHLVNLVLRDRGLR